MQKPFKTRNFMLTCTGHIKSKEDFWNTAQKYKYWRGDFITVLGTAKDIVNLHVHVHIKWIIIFSNSFKKNKCTQATTFDFAFVWDLFIPSLHDSFYSHRWYDNLYIRDLRYLHFADWAIIKQSQRQLNTKHHSIIQWSANTNTRISFPTRLLVFKRRHVHG